MRITIKLSGPMPDTDHEPGIWIVDAMREIPLGTNSNKDRVLEQSWKMQNLEDALKSIPDIIKHLCHPNPQ
jgi:hypothetical protein